MLWDGPSDRKRPLIHLKQKMVPFVSYLPRSPIDLDDAASPISCPWHPCPHVPIPLLVTAWQTCVPWISQIELELQIMDVMECQSWGKPEPTYDTG